MIKTKNLSVLLLFSVQFFYLNAYGKLRKIDEKINSKDKLEKDISPTTSIKGNLFFTLGALSKSNSSESLHFTYENKIRLNTTFKGTDNLLTVIESGNASDSPLRLDLQSKKGDDLEISTILYEFKLGDEFEAIIGPERIAILDGSNYTTASGIGPGIGISNRKKKRI